MTQRVIAGRLVAPVGDGEQPEAGHDHRQRQQLAHRHPVEEQVAAVRVRHAHELDGEAEHAVAEQEQPRRRAARPRPRGEPPQDDEQHQALEERPRRAAMACSGTPSTTTAQGTSVGLPHSSPLMKLPMRPAPKPIAGSGAVKSNTSASALAAPAGEQRERDQHADQAAVERHAAFPDAQHAERIAEDALACRRTASSRGGRRGSRRARRRRSGRRRRSASRSSPGVRARRRASHHAARKPTRYMRPYQWTCSGPSDSATGSGSG